MGGAFEIGAMNLENKTVQTIFFKQPAFQVGRGSLGAKCNESKRPWARPKAGPVIMPKCTARGRPPRKSTFIEKKYFRFILVHFGPSTPQKLIRLEILRWKMVSGGLET